MKVIITGGTGVIGRPLARRLAEDGAEVVILSRSAHRPAGLPESARVVTWDAKTGQGWSHELEDTDAVVNLAGSNLSGGRWTPSRKRLILESRINAGNAVTDGIKSSGHAPSVLIQASGTNYYGHRPDKYVDEDDPPGNDFLAGVCVEWERSTAAVESMGVRRVVTRSGPVLNVDEGALPPLAMPFHLFVGGRTGSGEQGFSWIHLDDEVEAMHFLINHGEISGPVNLCSPNPVSNGELAEALGNVMNRPSRVPVPAFFMRTALGEVADTVLLGNFVLPTRLQAAGYNHRFPTIDLALRDLLENESHLPGSPLFRRGAGLAARLLLP